MSQPSAAQIENVLKQARQALTQRPKDLALHKSIAELYEHTGRQELAVPHLHFLLKHLPAPEDELYVRCARAQQLAGNFPQALQTAEEGLNRYPDSPALLKGRATCLWLLKRYEEARDAFLLLSKKDESPDYGLGMAGFLTLLLTDMQEGYEYYAFRPDIRELEQGLSRYYPKWSGKEPLAGKKLLLWGEQGIGDIIMFAGFIPWLLAQGPKLTVVVNPKLPTLFMRSFPNTEIMGSFTFKSDGEMEGLYDYHVPMGDIMQKALSVYKPADHPPYLKADTLRAAELRRQYLERAAAYGRKKLIGIAWHTTNPGAGFTRTITLEDMKPLFALPGIQFVSLQYGDHGQDIAEINAQFPGILFKDPAIDAFNDMEGLAAQIYALDEVITISNASAHLAGALGAKITLLASATPDWRWRLKGDKSFWYPGVTLERQEQLFTWKPVIKRIRERLMEG